MKILFINPTLGGDYSALDIAITVLATYINERTLHKASICDLTFRRRNWQKYLDSRVRDFNPAIIGISSSTLYMPQIKRIAAYIKSRFGIPIILGGYHPSIHPEESLKIKEVDFICIGDAEYSLTDLLSRLENKTSIKGIDGIWFNDNGRIVKGNQGKFLADINSLPFPDWDIWEDLDKYFYFLGMLYIIGSRGCPYHCSYCDTAGIQEAVTGRYYRVRDARGYANEIAWQWEKYKKRNFRLAQLFDQVFTIDIEWLSAFCNEYVRLGLARDLKFSAFSRIDHLDEEKIALLGRSGCAILRIGIESGDDFIRNEIYGKNISDEKIRDIFELCRKYKVGVTAYYMLGGPAETDKTINKTISFANELQASRSAFFIYKPFTRMGAQQVVEYGGKINQGLWDKADNITFGAVIELKDIKPRQVEYLQKKAYFLTFSRRLINMLMRQKLRYFIRIIIYLARGLYNGLDFRYLLVYYHIYAYDNIDK